MEEGICEANGPNEYSHRQRVRVPIDNHRKLIHVFVLHVLKAGERISPFAASSILKISRTGDFSRFRIRQIPSWLTIVLSPR
jgi:hypothetical protein